MDEDARFVTGVDLGTNNIRVVQGRVNAKNGTIRVIGHAEAVSEGMRRGVISDIMAPKKLVDNCLYATEQMSGVQINAVTMSINGEGLASARVDGVISLMPDREIDDGDIERLMDIAAPEEKFPNRHILSVEPYEYVLDKQQRGIHEPFGMRGSRLEVYANVVSVMEPDYVNLMKSQEAVGDVQVCPAVIAAARAVLNREQRENGVAVVDMGATTTGVAVYQEGTLQYVAVVPCGGRDVTNDLAKMLQMTPDVAEEIKIKHASGIFNKKSEDDIVVKRGRDLMTFRRGKVDEVIEARLGEIFEEVRKHLKRAGFDRMLPEGVILTGGGARMRKIELYARTQLEAAVRVGQVAQHIENDTAEVIGPEYATAVGLMLIDMDDAGSGGAGRKKRKKKAGFLKRLFGLGK